MYVGSESLSPLTVMRNYQQAFKQLGDMKEIYQCTQSSCVKKMGKKFIWRESNLIKNNLGNNKGFIFGFGSSDRERNYLYAIITTEDALYHVSVSAAVMTYAAGGNVVTQISNKPVIHLEVVEVSDFKSDLVVIKAQEMTGKISETGRIALYGIQFDTDSDQLKAASSATLKELAKALKSNPSLNIYVAGHTDNQGTLEYNMDLSKRRAIAVVQNLISAHSIKRNRLTPIGVGPASPISSNKTDQGRTLNRRVELVER
jgi:outer membrane protein OmpA-like peptidoglycan-associated protein